MVQPPDAPPEVKEWAQNTVVGVLVGIIFGGGRQYLADRAAGATIRPSGTARASLRPRSGAHPLHGPDCSRPHGFIIPRLLVMHRTITNTATWTVNATDQRHHHRVQICARLGSAESALGRAALCPRCGRAMRTKTPHRKRAHGIAWRSLTYHSAARDHLVFVNMHQRPRKTPLSPFLSPVPSLPTSSF